MLIRKYILAIFGFKKPVPIPLKVNIYCSIIMGRRKKNNVENFLNKALSPIPKSYRVARKIVKRTKKSMPFVYDRIGVIVKSHLVSLEKDKEKGRTFDDYTKIITDSIMDKVPAVDSTHLKKVIKEGSSKSFLDMLTMGLSYDLVEKKNYTKLSKRKMFKSVLIANRGEIALRIVRACRELGIKAVVVYSKLDKDGLAVKFADRSYNLGSPDAYLDINKMIKVAKKAKVDAIHPGYGFLSENPEFAKLCEKNKIKFIGPSSKAMQMMGDKSEAKSTMIKANIPIIEGAKDILTDVENAKVQAQKIGYPVIIKAVAGGGGRGMRVVRDQKEFEQAFKSAQAEAKSAFGNDSLYMEKYIEGPRHIEFQILADKSGNVIHLGERDCSIQRRHQKLIEEAPSPALTEKMREEMGQVAINVAKAVCYEGAGTVEFLLDDNNKYYFMEMNTRIQVEHGVTEMVTGVDLIKEQIKIAAGARLAFIQEDIKINGWAIECRINAESPIEFVPSTGTITNYITPGGPGIRICSCSHTGHKISPHYDSMISKLMCGGKNRKEAISRMKRALDEYVIEGVETTIPFHKAVMANPAFLKGKITTAFIDNHNILSEVKYYMDKKKKLTKKEKMVIVSTAVTKYIGENKPRNNVQNNWVLAGRRELIGHERF